MTDVATIARRAVTTTAALIEGLSAEQKDELKARLEWRGYKPELSVSTRKTGVTGGLMVAASAYREFNDLSPTADGQAILRALRAPCCGVPDRSWQDPDTGALVERAITFGYWDPDRTITVAYRFSRIPDARDAITPAEIRSCFEAALACWMSVCGIKLELIDDFDAANIKVVDANIDNVEFSVLADMQLPGPGRVGGDHVCLGRFDFNEPWTVALPTRPLPGRMIDLLNVATHEFGHAFGCNHESGRLEEVMNPMYWPARHFLNSGTHWVGPKDTATMQKVYGLPEAAPPTPTPIPPPVDPGQPVPPPPTSPPAGSVPRKGLGAVRIAGGIFQGDEEQIVSGFWRWDGVVFGSYEVMDPGQAAEAHRAMVEAVRAKGGEG